MIFDPFIFAYGQVALALSQMLGVRFVPGAGSEIPVGRWLQDVIFGYHNTRNFRARDAQFNLLYLLAADLTELDKKYPKMRKAFAQRIRKCRNPADYAGYRFEVHIAALLAKKGMPFKKTERPDFTIEYDGTQVFIECASSHLSKKKQRSLRWKVHAAINEKSAKDYAGPDTALFVDITNLEHAAPQNPLGADSDLPLFMKECLTTTAFGSVSLSTFIYSPEHDFIGSGCKRYDNSTINPVLSAVLDQLYPPVNMQFHDYVIPGEG